MEYEVHSPEVQNAADRVDLCGSMIVLDASITSIPNSAHSASTQFILQCILKVFLSFLFLHHLFHAVFGSPPKPHHTSCTGIVVIPRSVLFPYRPLHGDGSAAKDSGGLSDCPYWQARYAAGSHESVMHDGMMASKVH